MKDFLEEYLEEMDRILRKAIDELNKREIEKEKIRMINLHGFLSATGHYSSLLYFGDIIRLLTDEEWDKISSDEVEEVKE